MVCEIAALKHEVGDHTVETRAFVTEIMLVGGKLAEVPRGLGNDVIVKLEDDAPRGLPTDRDIELLSKRTF